MSGGRAMRPDDATKEQLEEMHRQVRDLVNYLAKYDDPSFAEKLGIIRNPEAVVIIIQSARKYERGLATAVHMVAVGKFDPTSVAITVRDFLVEAEETSRLGKEIK